ncbi:MAG: chaperonin GroEL [Gammaproteobacteria bacterium]|nr:chaperonin GroEL [Gammaproteobacteria bacterium]
MRQEDGLVVRTVSSGKDAQKHLIKGIDTVANTVGSTLGAAGRTVIVEDNFGGVHVTKDGVSVADYINLEHPIENLGAEILKSASRKTAETAGDGTTTSTVLAQMLLHEALPQLKDRSFRKVIDELKADTDKILKEIDHRTLQVTESNLLDIATISANGDKELGSLISEAYNKVGLSGTVNLTIGDTPNSSIEVKEGSILYRGLTMPQFANVGSKCIFDNPLILLINQDIKTIQALRPVLEIANKAKRPLLIIGDLDQQALGTLATNVVAGNIRVNSIACPGHDLQLYNMMKDLALLTGGIVIGDDMGNTLDLISLESLGTCTRVVTSQTETLITFSEEKPEVLERVKDLKEQLEGKMDPGKKADLKARISLLAGKIAEVTLGGNTVVALRERWDRADDAEKATKCALQEGVLPGGGVALKDVAIKFEGKINQALAVALYGPYNRIQTNAGLDPVCVTKRGWGIDVLKEKEVNMRKAGIIDPAKVTKNALINAVDVVTTILSTDSVLSNLRKEIT